MPGPSTTLTPTPTRVLPASQWHALETAHQSRADSLTAGRRQRQLDGGLDEVEDFLYTYYPLRPGHLRRWHPGVGVALTGTEFDVAERATWRWHRQVGKAVVFDAAVYVADRRRGVEWIQSLLSTTASRPAALGCLGLHEWAMVYQQAEHRHSLPLRLGQSATDAVVESHPIRCTHFDAFRFFTPEARPRNTLQPAPDTRLELEQPGCLHANMDLLRTATKLGPAVPGHVLLDCFELARDIRILDMEASPYDVRSRGYGLVAIETAAGRAEYVRRQRAFAERSAPLRQRLLDVCTAVLNAPAPSVASGEASLRALTVQDRGPAKA